MSPRRMCACRNQTDLQDRKVFENAIGDRGGFDATKFFDKSDHHFAHGRVLELKDGLAKCAATFFHLDLLNYLLSFQDDGGRALDASRLIALKGHVHPKI